MLGSEKRNEEEDEEGGVLPCRRHCRCRRRRFVVLTLEYSLWEVVLMNWRGPESRCYIVSSSYHPTKWPTASCHRDQILKQSEAHKTRWKTLKKVGIRSIRCRGLFHMVLKNTSLPVSLTNKHLCSIDGEDQNVQQQQQQEAARADAPIFWIKCNTYNLGFSLSTSKRGKTMYCRFCEQSFLATETSSLSPFVDKYIRMANATTPQHESGSRMNSASPQPLQLDEALNLI